MWKVLYELDPRLREDDTASGKRLQNGTKIALNTCKYNDISRFIMTLVASPYSQRNSYSPYSPKTTFSDGDITKLSSALSKAINDSSLGERNGSINPSTMIEATIAKYKLPIEKQKEKTDKLVAQRNALQDLQNISSNLSSAIGNISTISNSGFSNLQVTGAPTGMTIQPSPGARTGATHTIAVNSIASKQTVVIQKKDIAGNPMPFAHNVVVTDVPTDGSSYFLGGNVFRIYSDSNNTTLGGPISVAVGQTLAQIAANINADAAIAAVLTATVTSDAAGDKLVLQSINSGIAGNFYIGDQYITGLNHAIPQVGTPSPLTDLSVSIANDDVQSIDIYTKCGNAFASCNGSFGMLGDANDTFQPGLWNIGSGVVSIGALPPGASLTTVMNYINDAQSSTGVTASIVSVSTAPAGYALRVQALPGCRLKYNPTSLSTIFPSGLAATASQVRPTTAADTLYELDGVSYTAGGNTTFTPPISDLLSVTVTAPVQATSIAIAQDVTTLTANITSVVEAINNAQQFIAQQQEDEAPLRTSNTLIQLQNLITSFVGLSSSTMSLVNMGISWADYTPTSKERREGNVETQYLQINATTLANALASNGAAIQAFFTGTLTGGTPTNASITSSVLSQVIGVPQFDLTVTSTTALNGAGQPIICTANATANGVSTALNVTYLGGNQLMITGSASTPFAGLQMMYTYTGGPGPLNTMPNGTAAGQILGIQVYNGSALTLSTSLTSYLNQYGSVKQSTDETITALENSQRKTIYTLQKRDKAIDIIKMKIATLQRKQRMAAYLQKAQDTSGNRE